MSALRGRPSASSWLRFWGVALFGLLFLVPVACAPVPQGRYTLEKLHFSGDHRLDDDELEEVIASKPSARFLGLFSGVIYEYEVFDRFVLERDLERIERYYRARGYYQARVRAARVIYKGRSAQVYIQIEEGLPVILRRIDIHGVEELPPRAQARIQARVRSELPLGKPFAEEAFAKAADELVHRLEDHGYAYVEVQRAADVDLPRKQASAGFWVKTGPKARLGEVTIEGLGPIPEPPVRRALNLRPGDEYSRSELDEAKRALLDLNVFSAVTIEPDFSHDPGAPRPDRVPIRVRVEPSKLRSVHLGGGVQLDTQRTDLHLIAGWENSNFLGGLRRFLVEAVPGVVLYPTRLPRLQRTRRLLPQVRLRSEFRQPGFLESRTNALVRAQFSIYPVIATSEYDPAAPILGYGDTRLSVGLERSMWRLYATLSQNVQLNTPFTYAGELDPFLGNVLISYPELFTTLDLRDDRVAPHKGAYFSLDTQVAGLGGDARDLKIQPEARAYIPVARRWTLALRGTTGFLFPQNYGETVYANSVERDPYRFDRRTLVHDTQLMFLRGFFSGGAASNRGYAAREIGPHGIVPFYNPGQSTTPGTCDSSSANYAPQACNLPLGGFTLWEASIELRFPLKGPLSGTLFSDASDVAPKQSEFRWDHPHLSVGVGLRYETPIGPVRADFGYRLPGMQAPSGSADEFVPREILGLPIAASFGIGEAF